MRVASNGDDFSKAGRIRELGPSEDGQGIQDRGRLCQNERRRAHLF